MLRIGLSQVIKPIVLSLDLLLVNLLFLCLYFFQVLVFEDNTNGDVANAFDFWVVIHFSFLFYWRSYKLMLYRRIIGKYKIILNIFFFIMKNFILTSAIMLFVDHDIFVSNLIWFYVCLFFFLICVHFSIRYFLKIHRSRGGNSRNCILVGDSSAIMQLYREMTENLVSGYTVNGYFGNSKLDGNKFRPKYLGEVSQVINYIQANPVEQVYCCLSSNEGTLALEIAKYCENHLIRFYTVPFMINEFQRDVSLIEIGNVPIVSLREEPLNQLGNLIFKRLFDIVFSVLFLVLVFPFVLLTVGIIIKFTSPGPIFFKQKRNGKYGKEFICYKFRSMKVNKESDTVQATKNDRRVTKFGEFLRKSSIDELPQFINVLLGDMSVVGPRPHMLKHTQEYGELINKYMVRHFVKPGVTGWAQVTGFRGETKNIADMEGRIKKDIWYIEHWSFVLDLYIIFLTIYNGIKGDKKAY